MKPRRFFADPKQDWPEGLLAISEEITSEMLIEAYSHGIFPWPYEESPVLWFCPDQRGVLDFKDLVVARSLTKFLKKTNWQVTFNKAFVEVIQACSQAQRPNQHGTWITQQMLRAYIKFHKEGYAKSVEVWESNHLIGGLYGVFVGGVFSAESMFYRKSNASKFALLSLTEHLQIGGLSWIDTQTVSPNVKSFGAKYISKQEFFKRLNVSQSQNLELKFESLSPG